MPEKSTKTSTRGTVAVANKCNETTQRRCAVRVGGYCDPATGKWRTNRRQQIAFNACLSHGGAPSLRLENAIASLEVPQLARSPRPANMGTVGPQSHSLPPATAEFAEASAQARAKPSAEPASAAPFGTAAREAVFGSMPREANGMIFTRLRALLAVPAAQNFRGGLLRAIGFACFRAPNVEGFGLRSIGLSRDGLEGILEKGQ